jgi:hypothetical protein
MTGRYVWECQVCGHYEPTPEDRGLSSDCLRSYVRRARTVRPTSVFLDELHVCMWCWARQPEWERKHYPDGPFYVRTP